MTSNKSSFIEELGYIVDEFDELQDLRWSDLQFLDEYRELKMKKNDGLPVNQIRLDELEIIFKNKIVTSARWNKFQNALVGMQVFIKTEVEGYINTKQIEFQENIDRFNDKGLYNPSIQYYQNNFVSFDDGSGVQVYLCLQNSLGKEPTNTTHWRKLTLQGARGRRGIDGVGVKFKGAYSKTTSYLKDDGVQYGGIMFVSLVDGNIDNTPDIGQDTVYWAKALDVTVTVRKMIGVRNIATQTSNVNFMTGEITSFNPSVDSLEVFQNSIRLTKDVDYTINPNNQSIDKVEDIWDGNSEQPIFFEFAVTKNILNNLVFSDGSAIENGTVAKSKLTTDVQQELDKIGILNGVGEAKEKANKTDLESHKAEGVSQAHLAKNIGLEDTEGNFVATELEGAMSELFTNVSNGKDLVSGAITGVDDSVVIPTNPTFSDLSSAIGGISTGKKWASATVVLNVGTPFTIEGLDFAPSLIFYFVTSKSPNAGNFIGMASKNDSISVNTGSNNSVKFESYGNTTANNATLSGYNVTFTDNGVSGLQGYSWPNTNVLTVKWYAFE